MQPQKNGMHLNRDMEKFSIVLWMIWLRLKQLERLLDNVLTVQFLLMYILIFSFYSSLQK